MTAQQITLEAIELVRAAFLEARQAVSNDWSANLTAWQRSRACGQANDLSRKAIQVFTKEAGDE